MLKDDKIIKGWIEQVDAISEEVCQIDLSIDVEYDKNTYNATDMLTSLKAEMQEVLDTQYTNGGGS